jgi:hypothetical protein
MAWLVMTVHPEGAAPGTAATGEWTLSGLRSDAVSEIDSAADWYSRAVVPGAPLGAALDAMLDEAPGRAVGVAAGVAVPNQEMVTFEQALVMLATRTMEIPRTERRVVMVADHIQPRTSLGEDPVTVPYTRSGAGMPRHQRQSARVARVAATRRRRKVRRIGSCSRTIASVCS